ncbi:protein DENND6A-like [Halichondria panicea]|uniref:protein DENND6A-like n=1 Tax=Halichondria panicea TaxID=6063 RepID=UPI00312B6197
MAESVEPTESLVSQQMNGDGLKADGAGQTSWDNFSQWLCAVCVVTFDLELGQALESIIPSDYSLSDTEKSNVCYLSFPDSNSGCMGDTQFHYRIRCSGEGAGGTSLSHTHHHQGAPLVLTPDPGYYYGFVYFRQVKDADIKRGYYQKSVVLLTRLPYITLFTQMVQKIAPDYFTNGLPSLEAACHSINTWLAPRPGKVLQLPLLGQIIQVRMPSKSDKIGSARSPDDVARKSAAVMVVPSVHDLNLYQALQPVLNSFELIWELVITNEPIAVMAGSPTLCANAVQALVSLIHPLKYASDYRPFFTIHDSEFKHYTTRRQAPPQVILGVTNPFFVKTLDNWPHLIRLADQSDSEEDFPGSRGGTGRSLGDGSDKPGVHTKYKPFLSRDKNFAKIISTSKSAPGKRPMEVHNVMIKRHALELTTSFIIPLERYLASLMPLKRDVSPWRPPPQVKVFDLPTFLETVEGAGPQLTTGIKGNWTGLYKRFVLSPNFMSWFALRKEEANQKLRLLHLDTLCKADMMFWMRDKAEVEVVDFLLQVKDCMAAAFKSHPSVPQQTLQALQKQIRTVLSKLPEDLQSCLTTTFTLYL